MIFRHRYRQHTRELLRLLQIAIGSSRNQYLTLTPELQEELAATRTSSEARASELPPAPADEPAPSEIKRALEAAGGNVSRAANLLGVSRYTLHRAMKNHGIVKRFDSE